MKSKFNFTAFVSVFFSVLSFVFLPFPNFFTKNNRYNLSFADASPALLVAVVSFSLVAFGLLIAGTITANKGKKFFRVFFFIVLGFIILTTILAILSPSFISTSSTKVSLGVAGGWFLAFRIILFIVLLISIAFGNKLVEEEGDYLGATSSGPMIAKGVLVPGTTDFEVPAKTNINSEEDRKVMNYEYDHSNYDEKICPRCGQHAFVKYSNGMVCHCCRKLYSPVEYEKLPAYDANLFDHHNFYPETLEKAKASIQESEAEAIKEEFGLSLDDYYKGIDLKDEKNKILLVSKVLHETDAESAYLIFFDDRFLVITDRNKYEYNLLNQPLSMLRKCAYTYYAIKEATFIGDDKFQIKLTGVKEMAYFVVEKESIHYEILRKKGVKFSMDIDKSVKEFEKLYGISWAEFKKFRISSNFDICRDSLYKETMYLVYMYTDKLFGIGLTNGDPEYDSMFEGGVPNLEIIKKHLLRIDDIYDVKVKHDQNSISQHHSASMGDMILGDLAFGEAGMLAAAVANNYDTVSTFHTFYMYVQLNKDCFDGKTLVFMETNSPVGKKSWDYFRRFENIAAMRAKNEVLNMQKPQKQESKPSYIDELRELKSLLDEGIITQEEFDAKKQELLKGDK